MWQGLCLCFLCSPGLIQRKVEDAQKYQPMKGKLHLHVVSFCTAFREKMWVGIPVPWGRRTHHPLLCVQGVQFQRGSIVPGDFTQQNIVFFPNLNLSKVSYPFGQFEFPLLSQSGDEPSERENSSKSWISRDCSEKDMQWKIGTHQDSIGFPQIKSFCQGGIWEFLIFRTVLWNDFQTVLWNACFWQIIYISPLSIFFIPQCSDYGWGWWLKTTMTWGFYPTGQTPARSSIQTIQNFIPWHCWWFRNPANQIWLVVYPTLCRWTYTY